MDLGVVKILTIVFLSFIFISLNLKGRYHGFKTLKTDLLTIYIVSLAIPIQISVIQFDFSKPPSSFGRIIFLGAWHVLAVIIFLYTFRHESYKIGKSIKWLIGMTIISVGSLFNPNNNNPLASMVGIYYIFALLVSSIIIYRKYNYEELLTVLWSSFKILVLMELLLAIAYPVLNLQSVTTLFYTKTDMIWSERGNRASAVGTFIHPGALGLFMSFIFVFFIANLFMGVRKREALTYTVLSGIVIILTQARTSYLISIISFLMVYILYKTHSFGQVIRHMFSGLIIIAVILYLIVFQTSVGETLFRSKNFEEVQIARMIHWVLGWRAFVDNPIVGAGINAHLSYISENISTSGLGFVQRKEADFFLTNPVHNSHLIILAELGLIGGVLWFWGLFSVLRNSLQSLFQLNKERQNIRNERRKDSSVSHLFTVGVILSYCIYAFAGWSSMFYYTFSIVLLAVFLSEKEHSENKNIEISE